MLSKQINIKTTKHQNNKQQTTNHEVKARTMPMVRMTLFESIGNDATQLIFGYVGAGHFGLLGLVSHSFHRLYRLLFRRPITYRRAVLQDGSLDLLKFALRYDILDFPLDEKATRAAARCGQLHLLKWLLETRRCPW
jgi:hypothetical protein